MVKSRYIVDKLIPPLSPGVRMGVFPTPIGARWVEIPYGRSMEV